MGSGAGEQLQVGVAVRPLLSLLSAVQAEVARLDPRQLPARDALDVTKVLDRIGRVADAGKMDAALRVAESSLWKRTGARSPADHLAQVTGVGVGEAMKLLKTAELVAEAPETRDALARGEVSTRQAAAVGEVEKLSPDHGRDLLARADRLAIGELETEAAQLVAAASPETDAEKAERHHRARRLAVGTGLDGMGWGSWRLPPAAHARLLAQLEPIIDQIFRDHRDPEAREAPEAYAADALVRVFDCAEQTRTAGKAEGAATDSETAAGSGDHDDGPGSTGEDWSFAKVIVRVDLAALDRGELAEGEVCEIAGQGPIPVADAWRMIDGDAFVAAVATRGTDIDKVVHLGRKPTVLQRTALEWLNAGECSAEGCTSKARLEIDHIADWADTGRTELSELTWPCGRCHDRKTHHGWTWGPMLPNGKRRLTPPDAQALRADDARAGPEPTDHPTPITDAPSVAERAPTPAEQARARTAHPSSRRSPKRSAPGQDGLFDTG